ncbi:hypothetical protein [Roseovarius salinarum]|uniref:hypothetical protein n=1 Tax=Roseovarius salinarum TaxID=1981892 RepID=UPI000C32E225|nr:hypothetical protein [Roseovarius salinarum]
MESGLRKLAEHLEAMAEEALSPRFYLSSLDPGVGKTTLLIHFIHRLLGSSRHDDVAILICLSRLEEVRLFRDKLHDHRHTVAIHTSDVELNHSTHVTPAEARVLLTTQQMVEQTCRDRRFEEVGIFRYQGRPRAVRVWDESLQPGSPVLLSTDDLGALLGPCRRQDARLADKIEALIEQLKNAPEGCLFKVPEVFGPGGGRMSEALDQVAREGSDTVPAAADHLMFLAGRAVPVRRSNLGLTMLLDYRETLPDDLAPMVILDASGRVRTSYGLWQQERGDLVRLKPVRKDYGNLRIRVWERGGGKASFRRHGETLLQGIARTMQKEAPEEDWLVVHHKNGLSGRFKEELLARLPPEMHDRVGVLHWGDHHGTNRFAHVRNVILAGTMFLPEPVYEAQARLACGMDPEETVTPDRLEEIRQGEHAHAILQALCRGSVRGLQGDACAPCTAYIVASRASGIPQMLPGIFPGCHVETWSPIRRELKGRVAEAVAHVDRVFRDDPEGVLLYSDLREALGLHDASNFRRTVRHAAAFQAALEDMGLEETLVGSGNGRAGIRKATSVFTSDDDDDEFDPELDLATLTG